MAAPTATASATVDTAPAGTVRGTVLVLPGRADVPSYYRRLATRLAVDGYATRIAAAAVTSVDDVAALWSGDTGEAGVSAVLGVDTSAGLLAAALADGRLQPAPAGVILAGTAVAGGPLPAAADDLAVRSACPVHRGVVAAEPAGALTDSAVTAVWPAVPVTLPALILHGEADPVSPLVDVLPLYEGWSAELVSVAGGLHDVLNDVHHRSVAAEVVSFLERLRADPAATPVLSRVSAR